MAIPEVFVVRLVALLALSLPLTAQATDLYVGPAQPYINVEDAIAAAVSGDTIFVEPGVYPGTYNLDNMSLSIIGTGVGDVVLECPAACATVLYAANGGDLILQNLTIDGANISDGLYVNFGTNLYATDVIVQNTGGGTRGTGLAIASGYAELTRVEVTNATVSGSGGFTSAGIRLYNATAVLQDVSVSHAELLNPIGGGGGCVGLYTDSTVTWDGGYLGFCVSESLGGAMYVDGTSSLTMSNVDIEHNTAQNGGAVACDGANNCDFSRVVMFDNHAEVNGGAIWLSGATSFDLQQSVVCRNDAALLGSGNGGGLWTDGASMVMKNNLIGSNEADQGAGLYLSGFTLGVSENNNYVHNIGVGYGMAIYAGSSASLPNKSDLIAFNTGDTAIYQVNGIQSMSYSNFYANVSTDHNGTVGVGVLYEDPNLVAESGCLHEHQVPEIGSPLIDAGYWNQTDYDGSQADIGMFGGQGSRALEFYDQDHDGYVLQDDCDDLRDTVHPDQDEYCDDLGIDDNCNGLIDNDDIAWQNASQLYPDFDGDGAGDYYAAPIEGCPTAALVANADDCFDADASAIDGPTYYADTDGDGYGDGAAPLSACVQPAGYVLNPDDCDDGNNLIGLPTPWYADFDGDGHGDPLAELQACEVPVDYVASFDDCNDSNAAMFGGNPEFCDGLDNDCNALIDDNPSDPTLFYVDGDADGWGDDSNTTEGCYAPPSTSLVGGDCDDANAGMNLDDVDGDGASTCALDCDDNDANLNVDDVDGDGYSTCAFDCDDNDGLLTPYDGDGDGYSSCTLDCDDGDALLTPYDGDGDGYSSCMLDCDDGDANRSPADGDLDGLSGCDGDCDDTDALLNVDDADGDGFSTCALDCDDGVNTVYPGATEVLNNGVDEDCDGVDQISTGTTGTGTTGTGTTGTGTTGTGTTGTGTTGTGTSGTGTGTAGTGTGTTGTGTTGTGGTPTVTTDTTDTLTTDKAEPEASGCDSTGGTPLAWTFLLPLLGLRRRR